MLRLKLPSGMGNLRSFVRFISDFAQSHNLSGKKVREVELAVEEAMVNIFRYAYPEKAGDVMLGCEMNDDGQLVIQIEDTGVPFDITSIPEPRLCADIRNRNVGGLGIFLIRKMVNEVHYRREGDRNILTLIVYPERRTCGGPDRSSFLSQHGRRV
ncbi:MAG TPA: ATP-binding protein [Syntrophales bacterium]|nr:ATP-binding protein [Syntrophobacterales bacterium]HRT70292.1 ATP-binding protein [Syntrophales bacterium]